jgi:triphosphoribosyl-dephospho-CoA synthetase
MDVCVTAQYWLLSSACNMRTSFYRSVALLYCIAPPINPLGLVAERGRDNIAVLLTIQRAHLFRRQSGVIAAPLNAFQILVSNLPADSIHSGGGSADRVILTSPVFELEYWS